MYACIIYFITSGVCVVDSFKQLLMLEAQYGTPPQYAPAVDELIDYYKKVDNVLYVTTRVIRS